MITPVHIKREGRQKRLQDRQKQVSAASSATPDSAWAGANSKAVYQHEAEQRRRGGVKHGGSAQDLVAEALRDAKTIEELAALVQQHKPRLTALHASCALGGLLDLLLQKPDPPPLRCTVDHIIAAADDCLLKTAHKLSALSLPAVLYRFSRLNHHNPPVLKALCRRALQVLPELEPQQVARLAWALGRQEQLAASQAAAAAAEEACPLQSHEPAAAAAAAAAAGRSAVGAAKRAEQQTRSPVKKKNSTVSPVQASNSQASFISNEPQGTMESSTQQRKAAPGAKKQATDSTPASSSSSSNSSFRAPRSKPLLLQKLLQSIEDSLPLMDSASVAATSDGLLALGPKVLEGVGEQAVLAWLRAVQADLDGAGRGGWQLHQVKKVLHFLQQLPVLKEQHATDNAAKLDDVEGDVGGRRVRSSVSSRCSAPGGQVTELDEATAAMLGAVKRAGFDLKQLWTAV